MQKTKFKNIKLAIDWVYKQFQKASLFYGHGMLSAWDEAVQLVMYAMKLDPMSGEEVLPLPVEEEQSNTIQELVEKRVQQRKPLAYLTHEAWFAGLPFYIDERALIPRSPFAEWIECQFTPWIEPNRVETILDIGTGSGCMAIAAALAFPSAQVDGVDISADALKVAAINLEKYQLQDRVRFIQSDLFENLTDCRYDIIMSNPPYVTTQEMLDLPEEYKYEPKLALEAGVHGLDIVKKILHQAASYLKPQGIILVEVGEANEALMEVFPKAPFIWLDLERGGEGLFLLTREELLTHF